MTCSASVHSRPPIEVGKSMPSQPPVAFLLPRNLDFRRDVLVAGETLAAVRPELAGEVLLQPGADLVSEVVEGVVEPDVHSVRAYNPT